jgi:predicted DNA-binding mobile mystery protein A
MKRSARASQARRELDRRFRDFEIARIRARPRSGWVRAIRGALGMSQADLAARLGISGAAVAKLEHAETGGGITLAKLSEIAAALDSTVIYALVPNTSLEETVQRQAHRVAEERLGYVAGTMALEDQEVPADRQADYLEIYAHDLIVRNDIWHEHQERVETAP